MSSAVFLSRFLDEISFHANKKMEAEESHAASGLALERKKKYNFAYI